MLVRFVLLVGIERTATAVVSRASLSSACMVHLVNVWVHDLDHGFAMVGIFDGRSDDFTGTVQADLLLSLTSRCEQAGRALREIRRLLLLGLLLATDRPMQGLGVRHRLPRQVRH